MYIYIYVKKYENVQCVILYSIMEAMSFVWIYACMYNKCTYFQTGNTWLFFLSCWSICWRFSYRDIESFIN